MRRFDDAVGLGSVSPAVSVRVALEEAMAVATARRYTFHLDLFAVDDAAAQVAAVALAGALGLLRADVDTYSASLSRADDDGDGDADLVFCLADGPEGAFCGRPSGHDECHVEGGVSGLRWVDGDAVLGPSGA